eukprot:TRINITY_DN3652_c0_g1_i2.p2 TRINITY_DN3652_c0_g1~~TRINITY_DN3652_c0_g1_i2.p2  ORF type:complete len:197 (+),score=57.29 TRINITY_DN3652_c0_g1_i2:207-797(+)
MADYRIVVVGSGGVGKSAITVMFIQGTFVSKYDPTIEDSYTKGVEVDQQSCTLDIMDTAGQEEFRALRDQYMKTGHGFLIVYSITSPTSYEAAADFRKAIARVQEDKPDIPIVLVGNKKDLEEEREVSFEEGKQLATRIGADFMEASAKNQININESFYALVRIINGWRTKHPNQAPPKTQKGKGEKGGKGRCTLF